LKSDDNVKKGAIMPDDSGVTLEYSSGHERLRLEAWGDDSIRVRVGQAQIAEELPGALIARSAATGPRSSMGGCELRSPPTEW
jgi:hypothetical protein